MEFRAKSERELIEVARNVAKTVQDGAVILLHGTLGAGKTVFARALIRSLTKISDLEVPSPTFTLVQTYDSSQGPIWHYDLYRLENSEDVLELGWEDSLAEGITIVEWPERLGPLKPLSALDIYISTVQDEPEHRKIQIGKI